MLKCRTSQEIYRQGCTSRSFYQNLYFLTFYVRNEVEFIPVGLTIEQEAIIINVCSNERAVSSFECKSRARLFPLGHTTITISLQVHILK
jgi:hypothetical protein